MLRHRTLRMKRLCCVLNALMILGSSGRTCRYSPPLFAKPARTSSVKTLKERLESTEKGADDTAILEQARGGNDLWMALTKQMQQQVQLVQGAVRHMKKATEQEERSSEVEMSITRLCKRLSQGIVVDKRAPVTTATSGLHKSRRYDNDNDTLREVRPSTVRGLALQA